MSGPASLDNSLALCVYRRIVGRLKDMVIRGGENLFPEEINAPCRSMGQSRGAYLGQMGMIPLLCKMGNVTHVSLCLSCVLFSKGTVSCMHMSATSKEKISSHALIRRTKRKVRQSHDLLSSSPTREPFSHLALEVTSIQLAPWSAGHTEPLS